MPTLAEMRDAVGFRWFKFRQWKHHVPGRVLWWMVWRLPPQIALMAFIRVYGVLGECGPEYSLICDLWQHRYGIRLK